MYKRLSLLLFVMMTFGLILSACGGGGGDDDAGDPTQVVKDLMQAIEDKKFDTISDFACEAQKDEVAETFDIGSAIASSLGGDDVDPQKVLDAMTFTVANLEITEKSKSGDEATVHVTARLQITVDPDKFKDLVRELLAAQGLADVPDSMIDQAADPILQQFEDYGDDMDEDLKVIKEDGKWLICDE